MISIDALVAVTSGGSKVTTTTELATPFDVSQLSAQELVELQAEDAVWNVTLADGLEDSSNPFDDGVDDAYLDLPIPDVEEIPPSLDRPSVEIDPDQDLFED
jgi:hypothetical protein